MLYPTIAPASLIGGRLAGDAGEAAEVAHGPSLIDERPEPAGGVLARAHDLAVAVDGEGERDGCDQPSVFSFLMVRVTVVAAWMAVAGDGPVASATRRSSPARPARPSRNRGVCARRLPGEFICS